MKLLEIVRFELAYQLRRAWFWLIFAALVGFAFLFVRQNFVADALYADFFVNSPFLIASATVFGSLLWLLLGATVAGEAAARDVATGMHPLVYAAPLRKTDYLGGRLLAAVALNSLLLLAVQAGILLAVSGPGVHPDAVGPFRIAAHATAYGYLALPNAFFVTALQFWLATRSGRPVAGYLGSFLLFFVGFFIAGAVLLHREIGTLLDPIGIRYVVEDLARQWTKVEQNTRLLALEGGVLWNRLVWVGVGVAAWAVTYVRFRFAHRAEEGGWRRGRGARGPEAAAAPAAGRGVVASTPIHVPHVPRTFGYAYGARRVLAIAAESFGAVARSWAGLALLVGIPLLAIPVVVDQMVAGGVPLVPRTVLVLGEMTAPLSAELSRWVIIPVLLVFFAGELVWIERDAGVADLIDSAPGSAWLPLLGKFLGLALVLVTWLALLAAAGMVAQRGMGHEEHEVGLYVQVLLGLQLVEYLLFALLALVLHVLVNQKYVGHLAGIGAWVFIVLAGMFGVEHNLLIYGGGPTWTYTEMRGFGASLGPWAWFKLYWAAWALLLAVLAGLLWVRGREGGLAVRLRQARLRLAGPTARAGAVAAALVLLLGGFVFYNVNVRNEYVSDSDVDALRAEYERRYRRLAGAPQPDLAGVRLRVELYPDRRAVEIRGVYHLVNRTDASIDSLHLAVTPEGVETGAVKLDRAAALVLSDDRHGFRIYELETPMQPGDSLRLQFVVHGEPRGFGNRGVGASVVPNGSHFTSAAWFPLIGYQRDRELISAADRRARGLEPRPVVASLYEAEARQPAVHGGIAFEAVVGTDADQVAVAPGALRRTWTEGGRRYFHYATGAPIGREWAFLSADYAVREGSWQDVAIRILHHPEHTANLERMMRGVQASLDYYGEQFGPYPYRHLTLAEHPGNGTGMHAEPSMVTFSEGTSYWNPEGFDFPFAVVAHEMAHQWTVPYAFVEGAPVLSEGVAWYAAIQVVERALGPEQQRALLRFMRQPYPYAPIRRGEPLLRGLDPYMAYRRGPFALFALGEYVGEERVNLALRRLREGHDGPDAPLATTLDLYRELRAVTPDSLRYLLHDLFEVNTFWQLGTERATARQIETGEWRVTLDVRARKVVADSAGVETEVPMDEWMEIGVYAPAEAEGDALSRPLDVRLHRIRSGRQTVTVTVPHEPAFAGIDPRHLLDWEESRDDDNLQRVEIGGRGARSAPPR